MVWHYVLQNLATGNFFYGQTKDTRKDDRHKEGEYTKLIASGKSRAQVSYYLAGDPKEGTHLDKLIHPKIDVLSIVKPNPDRGNNECFQLNSIKDIDTLLKKLNKLYGNNLRARKNVFNSIFVILSVFSEIK